MKNQIAALLSFVRHFAAQFAVSIVGLVLITIVIVIVINL